ncbi:hypothetical protein ECP02989426_4990 [Escherichia coli P0298942.6]|nr:hypothetical protein ECP02989426_4990 [Escherichia coli P0298942.6]
MVIFYGGQIADKVQFVHAGCGVNAFSGLPNFASVTIKNPLAL